jgi:hypothetical protein
MSQKSALRQTMKPERKRPSEQMLVEELKTDVRFYQEIRTKCEDIPLPRYKQTQQKKEFRKTRKKKREIETDKVRETSQNLGLKISHCHPLIIGFKCRSGKKFPLKQRCSSIEQGFMPEVTRHGSSRLHFIKNLSNILASLRNFVLRNTLPCYPGRLHA